MLSCTQLSAAAVVVIQIVIVLLWRHVINRRYYRFHCRRKGSCSAPSNDTDVADIEKGPSFTAFPKSLVSVRQLDEMVHEATQLSDRGTFDTPRAFHQVWPNTLFYMISCFCPGLVRSSTTALVAMTDVRQAFWMRSCFPREQGSHAQPAPSRLPLPPMDPWLPLV